MARMIAERADVIPVVAEVFRTHGYEGATLSVITEATGLGKGSLYHFFPGGKEALAAAVLEEIERWFCVNVFAPLTNNRDPEQAVTAMLASVDNYFNGGGKVCIVGVFALGDTRDRFAVEVHRYFLEWIKALAGTLARLGHSRSDAQSFAEEAVAAIQGGLVLARALRDNKAFRRTLQRLKKRLLDVR
jgi:AcrR family transcriptional regulator